MSFENSCTDIKTSVNVDDVDSSIDGGALEKPDKWLKAFPPSVRLLRHIFTSTRNSQILKYFYLCFGSILLLFGLVWPILSYAEVLSVGDDENESTSVPFVIFFYFQFMMYLYLPFYYFPLMQNIFISKNVKELILEVIKLTSLKVTQRRFKVAYFVTLLVNTVSMAFYMYYRKGNVTDSFVTLVWFMFYIFPISVVFGFLVCMLEAHRVQAERFREELVRLRVSFDARRDLFISDRGTNMTVFRSSSGTGSVDESCTNVLHQRCTVSPPEGNLGDKECDIDANDHTDHQQLLLSIRRVMEQYCRLHDSFRCTSDKLGGYYFTSFLIPLTIILSSIWSIYEEFFTLNATIGYVAMAIFYLLQLGMMLANVNETGNLASRDISSFLLRVLVHCSGDDDGGGGGGGGDNFVPPHIVRKVNGFVSCLMHIRIEIPFFGNFTLRARTLIAIVATLLGAIIPGIIQRAM